MSSLARQAEYENYEERHTVEYLKSFVLIPKTMAQTSGEFLEDFTERVIQKHKELHDMTQSESRFRS